MDTDELQSILVRHATWLRGEDGGVKADLRKASLIEADLGGADLRGADLRWADIHGANMCVAKLSGAILGGADLREADLRGADLRGADLRGADLRWADIHGANLRGADLRWADLSWAILREADLRGADLSEANGDQFAVFQIGKDQAIFAGGYGHIGCMRLTYQEWLDEGIEIGLAHKYTKADIARYMKWIKDAVAYLTKNCHKIG